MSRFRFDPHDATFEESWGVHDPDDDDFARRDDDDDDDRCEFCHLVPCGCEDDVTADDYLRIELKQSARYSRDALLSTERRLPKPKVAKPSLGPCSNVPCPNDRRSKLEKRCDTCYKHWKKHVSERPIERVAKAAHQRAGDVDGHGKELFDTHTLRLAEQWLAEEDRLVGGDERRRPSAKEVVEGRWRKYLVNGHGADADPEQVVDVDDGGDKSQYRYGVDADLNRSKFRAVKRAVERLRKDRRTIDVLAEQWLADERRRDPRDVAAAWQRTLRDEPATFAAVLARRNALKKSGNV